VRVAVSIVVPDDFPIHLQGTPAAARLHALGRVTHHTTLPSDAAEMIGRLRDAEVAVVMKGVTPIPRAVLEACPKLRLISRWGTGIERIDLACCRERGLAVAYTPANDSDEMAEHAIALMLAVMRRIPEMDRAMRAGQWRGDQILSPRGRTIGIVGLGAIGSRAARLAKAIGMNVLTWTHGPDAGRAAALGATAVPLEELLARADVVSLHIRSGPDTIGLLNSDRFALMKRGAYLINTARGDLVDREALLEALTSGRLAGAGFDVFHKEPLPADDPLLKVPNVVCTPHNGGLMAEVIARGLDRTVSNVENFLAGRPAELVPWPGAA
jgi:D-3-phosphoglycerate dehydrogenase / 2-oxoglutarate reductase